MRYLLRPLPVLVLVLLAGCQSMQYRGAAPNVRSFSEDPSLAQSYIGVDFEFGLADPDPNKPESAQTLAEPQPPEDPEIIPQPLPEPPFIPF